MNLQKLIYAAALAATLFAGNANISEPAYRNIANTPARQQIGESSSRSPDAFDEVAG